MILSEILSVLRWRFIHQTFKVVVKISKVVVSAVITDLGNGFFGFNKHFCSNPNPNTFHILCKCAVGFFLKISAK